MLFLLLFCSNPSTRWKQTYSLLTGCQRPRVSPTDDSSIWAVKWNRTRQPPDFKCEVIKFIYFFGFVCFVFFFLLNVEVPNYIIKFTCFCCLCIVLYCFSSFFFWGALITSNYSFCLIFFCFLLGCSCMLRCVVSVFFVYRFTFYSKLFTWAISCFCLLLFVFFCWAVSVRIERGPWTCFSFRWFACFALDLLAVLLATILFS